VAACYPVDRLLTPRPGTLLKCKPLKGEHKGYWEYELAQFKRLIYWPDHEQHVVYIDYLGKHPDWRKRRRMPR
jgi:mRNA-degrading endonuclease YafQ of YafQ-DinJ toxin-antitoxin module